MWCTSMESCISPLANAVLAKTPSMTIANNLFIYHYCFILIHKPNPRGPMISFSITSWWQRWQRQVFWLASSPHPSSFFSDRCTTHGKRSSRKNVSDHRACRNKMLTAAGLSGLLTRFPFNHYAHISMWCFLHQDFIAPTAVRRGSEPIAGAKLRQKNEFSDNFMPILFGNMRISSYICKKL